MTVELDTSKIKKQIERFKSNSGENKILPIILVLGGSFCPVHKMHIETINVARKFIEKDPKKKVIGAYLIPSTDAHVKGKLGNHFITLKERNLMIGCSIEYSDFIMNCNWGCANSIYAGKSILSHIQNEYSLDKNIFDPIQVYYICGGDFAVKVQLPEDYHFVIIGRGEYTKILKEYLPKLIERNTFIEDDTIYDLSSTIIRRKIKNNQDLSNEMYPKAIEIYRKVYDEMIKRIPNINENKIKPVLLGDSNKFSIILFLLFLIFLFVGFLYFNKF